MSSSVSASASASPAAPATSIGILASLWGVVGLFVILGQAVLRLVPLALEPVQAGNMDGLQWSLYVGFVIFNAYAEGYRGFQLRFSPRVAARVHLLLREPTALRVVLAPAFLMGLVDSTRKRLIVSWVLVLVIAGVVTVVRGIAQPWRGIIDGGVVVGLGWGMLSVVWELLRVARGEAPRAEPETAGSGQTARSAQNT